MLKVGEISHIKNNNVIFLGDKQVSPKTEPIPADSVEISAKKQGEKTKKAGAGEVAAFLGAISVAVAGATFGGIKFYDKFFQKLACGIKKGEINDALFNFIKKNDPKGELFNNAETIRDINKNLTDDNLLILKQLAKMTKTDICSNKKGRFYLVEIADLLKSTNEGNIKYLEQLASKTEKVYGEDKTLETSAMINILSKINPENEKVVGGLIDITKVKDNEPGILSSILEGINKDNVDTYQFLLNTRKKGKLTSLELVDLKALVTTLQETKNPKCAELLLNLEKDNGTASYRYSIEELQSLLRQTTDDKIDLYKQLFELKSVKSINPESLKDILKNINEHNIDLIDTILTKMETDNSSYAVFRSYNKIGKMLEVIDKDSKDIAKQLIGFADRSQKYIFGCSRIKDSIMVPENCIRDILNEIKNNPQREQELKQIIEKGSSQVNNREKFDLFKIYTEFFNIDCI